MSLDAATVRRIAKLARLHVAEPDIAQLQAELGHILGWIEQLNEVDVSQMPPLPAATPLRLRPDVVSDGGTPDLVLANAPDRQGMFYAVPRVVE